MNTMSPAALAKIQKSLCHAGTALAKLEGEEDPIMREILRDAARAAVSQGLDMFEIADGAV